MAVGERIDQGPPPVHRGIGHSMRARRGAQHGRPGGARGEDRTRTEGKGRGALQESEGPIVPTKRGNSRGGKGPWFRVFPEEWTREGDWREPRTSNKARRVPREAVRESQGMRRRHKLPVGTGRFTYGELHREHGVLELLAYLRLHAVT